MTPQRAAVAHVANCITHNRPIDRALLAGQLGRDFLGFPRPGTFTDFETGEA